MEAYFPQILGDVNSAVEFTHTGRYEVRLEGCSGESEQSQIAVDTENRSGPDLAHIQWMSAKLGLDVLQSRLLSGVSGPREMEER